MEDIKIKDALRTTMMISSICNGYLQEQKPWDLAKSDMVRCQQVMNTSVQALFFLSSLFEPYMPSFSAKVYHQMNITRTALHEKLYEHIKGHPERIESLVPSGHQIGEPRPIFREIADAEAEKWREMFGGEKETVAN